MSIHNLILRLKASDIRIGLKEDQLTIDAPRGVSIDSFLNEIRERKGELIEYLAALPAFTPYHEINPVHEKQYYDLSHAQRRILILSQLEEELVAYNMIGTYELRGTLNLDALARAFDTLVDRHQILRTTFRIIDGEPKQVVNNIASLDFAVGLIDLRGNNNPHDAAVELLGNEAFAPFNLEKGPLLRVKLLQLEENHYVLHLVTHHIVCDGWSMSIIFNELLILYNAYDRRMPNPLLPLKNQYKDYVVWEQQQLQSEVMRRQKRYWTNLFSGDIPVLELPTDFSRPVFKTYDGRSILFSINPALAEKVKTYSLKHGGTLFMMLVATVKALLYRYSGQEDIVLGTPAAGRSHANFEGQIGPYINTLALRTRFNGTDSFSDFFERIKANIFEAYQHQDYPFDSLVDDLALSRDMSRSALFDVMIVLQNTDTYDARVRQSESVRIEPFIAGGSDQKFTKSKFDLMFNFSESDRGLFLSIDFSTDLFRSDRIERLFCHYERLVQEVLVNDTIALNAIDFLTLQEKNRILVDYNMTQRNYPLRKSIVHLFEESVMRYPDRIAVVCESRQFTYAAVNSYANKIAHVLKHKFGIGENDVVGIYARQDQWTPISVFGVLKAGAAYLPLDTGYPMERVSYMLQEAGARLVLTQKSLLGTLDGFGVSTVALDDPALYFGVPDENLPDKPAADDRAYIMFTSGSTGRPKGVVVSHTSVVNLSMWLVDDFFSKHDEPLVAMLTASISFDVSVQQLFSPLVCGSRLVLIGESEKKNPELYLRRILEFGVNIIDVTPSYLKILLEFLKSEQPVSALPLKYTLVAGEALHDDVIQVYRQVLGSTSQLVNVYGITETTVYSTVEFLGRQRASEFSIGKPISNTTIYILDSNYRLVPEGVEGEIFIGGAGVAQGYLNAPELTAFRFLDNPFNEGTKFYRTGDRGRWLPDGNIEFLGRKDNQVKVRGYRIELDEIRNVLLRNPAVEDAVVTVGSSRNDQKQLVAYYKTRYGDIPANELRDFVTRYVPVYMIPASFVSLASFPLTANGKIDTKKLPAPAEPGGSGIHEHGLPETETQSVIREIWEFVLDKADIGIHDNYFELGGNSLDAIQMISRIYKSLQVKLELRTLFLYPTIEQLAKVVEQSDKIVYERVETQEQQEYYDLSHAQKRLWLLTQMWPNLVAYNINNAYLFEGDINVDAFCRAYRTLVERHESLRTTFITIDGDPRQKINSADFFAVEYRDIRNHADGIGYVRELFNEETKKVFNLDKGPLINVKLIRISDRIYAHFMSFHHIIFDGWSMAILEKELLKIYNAYCDNLENPLAPLRVQYKDFAVWQNRLLKNSNRHRSYWLEQFNDEVPALALSTDFPRPKVKTYNGRRIHKLFPAELCEGLKAVSNSNGASLFMTLLTSCKVLLFRHSGQTDITMGAPTAGRNHRDLEGQIGFYLNTLPLRTRFRPTDTFADLLAKVKKNVLDAFEHQLYPFDSLVEELNLTKDLSRSPLFDVFMILQNFENAKFEIENLDGTTALDNIVSDNTDVAVDTIVLESFSSQYDLIFTFTEAKEYLNVEIQYNSDLFTDEHIQLLANRLGKLFIQIVNNPGRIVAEYDIMTEEDKALLMSFNNTDRENEESDMVVAFQRQVDERPDAVAIIDGGNRRSYRYINEMANRLARFIQEKAAISREGLVMVALERSEVWLQSILAIWKCGGVYMPADVRDPVGRIRQILDDARPAVAIVQSGRTGEELLALLSEKCTVIDLDLERSQWLQKSAENLDNGVTADQLAYVIYTSGSTGVPKGAMVEHGGMMNHILAKIDYFDIDHRSVIAQSASQCFDISVWQLFAALAKGGCTAIFDNVLLMDPKRYLETVSLYQVTILQVVPSYLIQMLEEAESAGHTVSFACLKYLIATGDVLKPALVKRWQARFPMISIANAYGPTEASDDITHFTAAPGFSAGRVPIGKAIRNTRIYIVDQSHKLCPVFVNGEIWVSGAGVGRGYLNNETQTRKAFIIDPFTKKTQRLYKTADVGRYLKDGNIEFFGRMDDQIKIRGYRIEIGEVENHIMSIEGVDEVVVVAKEDRLNDKFLCAYITLADGVMLSGQQIKITLKSKVPNYLVPDHIIILPEFPLTSNGKIDRKALPEPQSVIRENAVTLSGNAVEEDLRQIWKNVLELDTIDLNDNFFESGGNSIKLIKLYRAVEQNYPSVFEIADLFSSPTIMSQALQISGASGTRDESLSFVEINL